MLPEGAGQVVRVGELEERHLAQLLHGLAGERAELRVGVDELAVGGQDRLRNRVL